MSALSNNSPREISIYEAREHASNHIVEIFDVIEDIAKSFTISVKFEEKVTTITLQDATKSETSRMIVLEIFSESKSYAMTLFHHANGVKDTKSIYKINARGNYRLDVFQSNLEKLIKGQNLIHRPRFYPF